MLETPEATWAIFNDGGEMLKSIPEIDSSCMKLTSKPSNEAWASLTL